MMERSRRSLPISQSRREQREMKTLLSFSLLGVIIGLNNGVQGNSWSLQVSKDITVEVGKVASLPCVFSHPHKNHHGGLTVIWRVKQPYNGTVVFRCTAEDMNEACKTTTSYMNKFRLIGNPRNNDVSISINNLTWEDSNRYYCRVELSSDRQDKYETKSGTLLHVSAPPRIMNISVGFDHVRGYHAVCIAEGEPVPSLVWVDPRNFHQDVYLTSSTLKHRISTELHYLHQDGRYTCVATNSLGRVEGSVYFFKFKPEGSSGSSSFIYVTLWAALGAKLLLVVLMSAAVMFYSKDTTAAKDQQDCQATCIVGAIRPEEAPEDTKLAADNQKNIQESAYENYAERSA